MGHERIALVARAESPNTPLIREGYATACQALGLTAGPEYRIGPTDGPASTEWFEELARAVEAGDVGAALVHNDLDAVTLVGLLQARGLRVPEDLAIVTYDDEVAELSDVPLTAVAPPKRAVGAWAVDLMRRLPPILPHPLPSCCSALSCGYGPPAGPPRHSACLRRARSGR